MKKIHFSEHDGYGWIQRNLSTAKKQLADLPPGSDYAKELISNIKTLEKKQSYLTKNNILGDYSKL